MLDFLAPPVVPNVHNAGYGMATFGGDDRLMVRFFRSMERNNFKSEKTGEPVFDQIDMISIRQPGERDDLHRAVQPDDQFRFPRQWAAYQANNEQTPDGTPLEILFDTQPEIVRALRGLHVLTVEQLAGATEAAIGRMGMGARKWVERAQVYCSSMKEAAGVRRLEAENEDLRTQMELLRQQLADIGDRVDAAPRRGRPPKLRPELEDAA